MFNFIIFLKKEKKYKNIWAEVYKIFQFLSKFLNFILKTSVIVGKKLLVGVYR